MKIYSAAAMITLAIAIVSCEGNSDEGYDNAGLSEKEVAHTRAIIDSSLGKFKKDLLIADSVADNAVKKEIKLLREEIEALKKKKK